MIIDVVGMRGSGKSTFCRLMKEEYGALLRENRNLFHARKWSKVKKDYPELTEAFNKESSRYRNYITGKRLPKKIYKYKIREIQIYDALQSQLEPNRIYVWDKGFLEVLTYLHLHGVEPLLDETFSAWPKLDTVLLRSKDSFQRSIQRVRHEQWDKKVYTRMSTRHKSLTDNIPHKIVDNNGSVEDLKRVVQTFLNP